jgi:carbonic anhydrase
MSSNGAWAGYKAYQNPQFFPKLASGQAPQIRKFVSFPLHSK